MSKSQLRTPLAARHAVLGLLVLVVAGIVSLRASRPPAPLPADAPAEAFSASRAMIHVNELAASPRPVGTPAHAAAREKLLAELGQLGLRPQVQRATVARARGSRFVSAAVVENVVARLPGREAGPAVLLMAHYDTRPTTAGAADDASGTAAVLETVRALRARPVPRRDIIVLITDGEEAGLMGARAFVDEHPWKSDVGVVVNLEARGQRGPAIMFETSGPANAPLVEAFANSGAATLANSLTAEVYRRLPNDTDLTVFARQNIAGFNIAFIGGLSAYHTALDRPETLDLGSLQQMGDAALALAVELSERPIDLDARGTSIYWNPLGAQLIRYPGWLALPLALLAALLWGSAVLLARGRGLLELTDLLRAILFGLLALVLVAAVAFSGFWLLLRLAPSLARGPYGLPYDGGMITFALLALGTGAAAWALARGRLPDRPVALALGTLAFWLLLAIGVSIAVPGASFLLTWPLVAASLGCAVATFMLSRGPKSAPATLLLTLGALPGVVLMVPILALLQDALTVRATVVLATVWTLVIWLVAPLWAAVSGKLRTAPLVLGVLGLAVLLRVVVSDGASPERPAVDSLAYRLDADSGEAQWVSADRRASHNIGVLQRGNGQEPKTREPSDFPFRGAPMLTASATTVSVAAPELQTITAEPRFLRVRLLSPRGGAAAWIEAKPAEAGTIEAVWVDANRVQLPGEASAPVRFRIVGLPSTGLALAFEHTGTLDVRVVDQTYDLPAVDGWPEDRPHRIAQPTWLAESTLVSRWFSFPEGVAPADSSVADPAAAEPQEAGAAAASAMLESE